MKIYQNLDSMIMSVQLPSENVNSVFGQSCFGAFSDAIASESELGLSRWNRILRSVLQAQFHDASVVFTQCRGVEESQSQYICIIVIDTNVGKVFTAHPIHYRSSTSGSKFPEASTWNFSFRLSDRMSICVCVCVFVCFFLNKKKCFFFQFCHLRR